MSSWSSFNEGSLNTGGEIFKEKGFSIATIVVAVLLSISTAALFAELWWLKRRYLKRGLEKRLTTFFYYLHFPLLVAWVLEVVACALRIVWSQNGSFDARLNEYWLRIIAISFFQVYLILMLVYLFALSKKMKWLNMNLYDTTLLKPMFFKSSLFFTVVFAGETLVGFVIVVRIVNQFLINNGDFHKSVISFFEGWLLLAEVLILMSYFLVITQLNYWYSSLELAWEIYSLKSAVDRSYVADQGPPI